MFTNLPGPDGILGTPDDDLCLNPESPCINRGDTKFLGLDVVNMDRDGDANEPILLDLRQDARVLGSANS